VSFKTDPHTRHIGPMAQDFTERSKRWPDDTHIATVDEGGVATGGDSGAKPKTQCERGQKFKSCGKAWPTLKKNGATSCAERRNEVCMRMVTSSLSLLAMGMAEAAVKRRWI